MNKLILAALVLSGWLLQPVLTQAKDTPAAAPAAPAAPAAATLKTVALIVVESYDDLMADVGQWGKLAQYPSAPQFLDGLIKVKTQGLQGLQGLDTKRPWGVVVSTDGNGFSAVGCLPVTNLKKLLASLAPAIGPAKEQNGLYQVGAGPGPMFVKESNGWALISNSQDSIATAPKDPAAVLATVGKSYNIGVMVNVQNIPEMFRELALNQLKQLTQALRMETMTTCAKLRQGFVEGAELVLKEAEQATFGISLDRKTSLAHIDLQVVGTPGTKLAKELGQPPLPNSAFAGFLNLPAAMVASIARKLSEDQQAGVKDEIEALRSSLSDKIEDAIEDESDEEAAAEICRPVERRAQEKRRIRRQ